MENVPVDVKGAIELARRLRELHGDDATLGPRSISPAEGVAPMFVWTGVEPPIDGETDDAVGAA